MGIYADLRANAKTIDFGNGDGSVGDQRAIVRELERLEAKQGDLAYPSGTDAVNEVQEIAEFVQTGGGTLSGDFDLTITLNNGESITVANIAFDASAATIETAIDTEADGALTGFTAGDIAVTGGPMDTAPIVLTFSGASVAGQNHPLATTNVTDVVDDEAGGGAVTVTTEGQTDRPALGILIASGVIENASLPVQGEDGSFTGLGGPVSPNAGYPSQLLIRALAKELAAEDENAGIESAVLTAAGLA